VPRISLVLVLGALVGVAVLFAWRRGLRGNEDTSREPRRVAVLPFENLGDSADAYFADGVANDLRAKLAQIGGLAVTARGSSNAYKGTGKTHQQVARELGVDYLLTATVQWEKAQGATSRVRVTPELVDVRAGRASQTRWAQAFDAEMTDVFLVQSEIAGRVIEALNVALGDSTRRELASRPTQNLPAYEAFLRGEAVTQGMTVLDASRLGEGIEAYEQAVALDSTFVKAWAQLSRAQAYLYSSLVATAATGEAARSAAERARTLAPDRPEGHQAMGAYYGYVLADKSRAFTEDSTALSLAPGSADLLWAVGFDEVTLGRWEAARGHLERAGRLDPRSSVIAHQLGSLLLYLRDYSAAERILDRALQLLPADLLVRQDRAAVALAQGDLASARFIINAVPTEVDPTTLVAFVANYLDLVWLLDDPQQRLLLRLRPSAFDDKRATWAIVIAQTYAVQGDMAQARLYADSARLAYERQLDGSLEGSSATTSTFDAQRHVFLGLAHAYLGHKVAAIREGERGVALSPISRDAFIGPYIQHQLARIYVHVGEPEKALDYLEALLAMPYYLSRDWLRIDPNFTPLRGNPRFERLASAK
jgi:TolB-like protein/Flp pilus assembly protein TadD